MSKSKRLLMLLFAAAICLVAWIIFVHHLNEYSMWWDEHHTWRLSRGGPVAVIEGLLVDVHPPFSYLWAWLWMIWMGGSDNLWVIRMSSVIISMLTVAFTYRIGKDWFKSSVAGAGAAVFLLTSGIFVYYTRLMRMYAPVVLLAVLSWLLLQRMLENKSRFIGGYAAALALMAYTHYMSIFIVVAQLVFVLVFYRQQFRRLLMAYALAFVAFIPWLPGFIEQLEQNRAQNLAENALLAGPLPGQYTSLNLITRFWNVYTNHQGPFTILLILLAIIIGLRYGAALRSRRWLVGAAMWFFLSMVFVFSFGKVVPVYLERFVLIVLPGLALLVGAGIRYLPDFRLRLATVGLVGLAGILGHPQVFNEFPTIPPYRQLLVAVAEHFHPGDKIWYNLNVGARGSSLELSADYHLRYDTPQLNSDDFVWNAPRDFNEPGEGPRVWDIRPYWIPMLDDVKPFLTAGRFITEEYTVEGYSIKLYESPPMNQPPVVFGDWFELVVSPMPNHPYVPEETVNVTSWWRAKSPVPLDYSYGLYLRSPTQEQVAQVDEGLKIDMKPTSQWPPQGDYVPQRLSLTLPPDLSPGEYDLLFAIYYWEDAKRLPVTSEDDRQIEPDQDMVRLGSIRIE